MANVYLAFYQGKGDWKDRLIRFFTKGKYSHCEIMVKRLVQWGQYDYRAEYDFYSSSPRDGGVRKITLQYLNAEHWYLMPIGLPEHKVTAYFNRTSGAKYDWRGVLGLVLGLRQKKNKFFCSEWCFNLIFECDEGWRFNPNQLAVILQNGELKNGKNE
ncbi:enoyl-CoA hydratase [[Haemophilus] felis]|uniref:Enoyl-CoA hydratase n=1 Tax=[Haemophilus] felis TaxID=123822 RepID=A0A1T0BAX4_9PAST|nr:enoyl-CoA hydratase [[Haemophilus] felis]NBI40337.1 enoyl-CoA hydratase [[Haemophilus] felis]OOS07069.1 hypothetical protein B0188_01405 [[Haemophilus] felis]